MSAVTAPHAPLRYRGHSNRYVDIAVRGTDEHLGFSIEYAIHPSNVGCFILRFVAHGKDAKSGNFTHLTAREPAQFACDSMAETFGGLRLNKLAIKAFQPAIHKSELDQFAQKFNVWPLLTAWVEQQVTAEEFTLTVNLQDEIRQMLVPAATADPDSVACVIDFPDLAQQKTALKLVKPEPEDDDTDDDSETGSDKEWLN